MAKSDKVAAGAIDGAAAVRDNGGTADDVVAGAIGGAAAGAQDHDSGVTGDANDDQQPLGRDYEAEFDKATQAMLDNLENTRFTPGTLLGDMREARLQLFKDRPRGWDQMREDEQRDFVRAIEQAVKIELREIVNVVAKQGQVSIVAKLESYSEKDGFKISLSAPSTKDIAMALFDAQGSNVVLFRADDSKFHGQARDADIMPDQPALFPDDERHPTDDDLAGEV